MYNVKPAICHRHHRRRLRHLYQPRCCWNIRYLGIDRMQGNTPDCACDNCIWLCAISCAVASDDMERLVWCWRKVRHNRDEVLVLCHPPPISLLHIADTQPLLYLQVYSPAVVSHCCRGRSQSLRTDMHLVSSYCVAKRCIPQTDHQDCLLPSHYTDTSAASPASMTSSTVASFLQNCSALSLNNALEVNLFSDNPFPRPYSLDVVAHPNIACMNRMLLQMSAPNSLCVTLISQMRFFFGVPRVEHCMNKSKPSGSA